jgi:hypothetical protein
MERVYINHCVGERRIHIEVSEAEIAELVNEQGSPAARRLAEILEGAHRVFRNGRSS